MKKLILLLTICTAVFSQEYNRRDWRHWIDADGDGQDTRQEVLIEENLASYEDTEFDSTGRIIRGLWVCAYTGDTITNPRQLDVDHFIPLKEAHISGAITWYESQREIYANFLSYPDHLIAVSASANRSKGARDPSDWMPEINRCWYLRNWLMIKEQWDLSMDYEEQAFIEVFLEENCNCECP